MKTQFRKVVAFVLLPGLLTMGSPAFVRAEIISTEAMLSGAEIPSPRARVAAFLSRPDVQEHISRYDLSSEEVSARITALSDDELATLAERIEQAPAGGDGVGAVVGGILIIFLVLLVTDIMGFTKFYPFTRSVGRSR